MIAIGTEACSANFLNSCPKKYISGVAAKMTSRIKGALASSAASMHARASISFSTLWAETAYYSAAALSNISFKLTSILSFCISY